MSIYREYDIRGIVTTDDTINLSLNKNTTVKIGYTLGKKIKKYSDYIAIGYDARSHSKDIFNYLSNGLAQAKLSIINLGMIPTPLAYYAINTKLKYDLNSSIMITGSHNPPEYNGLKITINKKPFYAEDIYKLENEVNETDIYFNDNIAVDIINLDIKNLYIEYICNEFKSLKGFSNKKIVYDCGNGVAGTVITDIFKNLNIDAYGLYTEPDGTFPNHHPDPSVEKNLEDIKTYLNDDNYIGFAYDGDADRIAVVTDKYNIKGDLLAILYSKNLKPNSTIIGEVKCSDIMYQMLKESGHKTIMYKTGHSNLKVKLKESNADLAVEVSGHIFFNDRYFGYDDAIYATFRFLELCNSGLNIDKELKSLPKIYSTDEIKIEVNDDIKFEIVSRVTELIKKDLNGSNNIVKEVITIDGVRVIFDEGWALLRASNTTPCLVTRFESSKKENLHKYEKYILDNLKIAKSNK